MIYTVSCRDDLKNVYPGNGAVVYLTEGVPAVRGRFGMFIWQDGDLSVQLALDVAEGMYVGSNYCQDGAFVRVLDGPMWTHHFGIVANSEADEAQNTIGLKSMMALATLDDTAIEHGNGLVWLNEPIDVTTSHVLNIRSAFSGGFVWACQNGGMHIEYTDVHKAPTISGLSFLTAVASGGKALRILAPDSAVSITTGPLFENLKCGGLIEGMHYWSTQIEIENAWYGKITNYRGKGKDDATEPFDALFGIRAINCQALTIKDWKIFHTEIAYQGDGAIHGEGINFSGGEIVGCSYGIVHTPAVYKPCITVHDMHINAYKRAMVFRNVGQMKLHDVHVYKTHPSTSYWRGIELDNCQNWHIHDIYGSTAGCANEGADLLVMTNCRNMEIHHLMADNWYGHGAIVIAAGGCDRMRISQLLRGENATLVAAFASVGSNGANITVQ